VPKEEVKDKFSKFTSNKKIQKEFEFGKKPFSHLFHV